MIAWSNRNVGLLNNGGGTRTGAFVPPTAYRTNEYYSNYGQTNVGGSQPVGIKFIASSSNPIYGGSYVVPRYCKIGGYIIKYI